MNNQWNSLKDKLKPYSALQITFLGEFLQDLGKVEDFLTNIFAQNKIPCVLRIDLGLSREFLPEVQEVSALFARFSNLLGVTISNFSLNLYPSSDRTIYPDFYQVDWVSSLISTASKYGRFVFLSMSSVELVRLLSHPKAEELLKVLKNNLEYVIPGYSFDGYFSPIGLGSILGFYLGEYVNRIGVECGSHWYNQSYLVRPCIIGKVPPGSRSIYTPLYRVMILEGVLVGATVYLFPDEESLWVGKDTFQWNQAIEPTLTQVTNLGLIPSKEIIQKRVKIGYKCFPAGSAQEFWKLGETLFPQFGSGMMVKVIYGSKESHKLPDVVPEIGYNYILPLFPYSALAGENIDIEFVGYQPNFPEWNWSYVSEKAFRSVGEGSAFITSIGKYLFVFNSSEHQFQLQSYKIVLPSPVRRFTASRFEGNKIQLKWTFREGDVSYQVYRRYPPSENYELLSRGIENPQWEDTLSDISRSVGYSVTALTTETEVLEDVVGPGEYEVFSLVESRIAEEVVMLPEMNFAESVPIIKHPEEVDLACPDPVTSLGSTEEQEIAREIERLLSAMETAIVRKDVDAICALFSQDYKDSMSSGIGHIKYMLVSFFNLVPYPKFLYQIRNFNFEKSESGDTVVRTQIFMKVVGFRISDSLGIKSAIQMELGPSEDGEVTLSWCRQNSLWMIKSSDKSPFNLLELNP
ncbi:MAG: hypothetical protein N3G21_07155 [Candidatus Hydrogenedentes bacterium]|nr:hypothetical protein [Candidatus Hydrogenedentota bacterium]